MSEELQDFMQEHGQEYLPEELAEVAEIGQPEIEPDQAQEIEPESQGPSTEELNNPNSEYWRQQAEQQGWKDGVTGRDGYAKSAREYVNDGSFMNQIHSLKSQQERIAQQQESMMSMQRAAHEAKIKELQAQRARAVEEADTDRFNSVDQQLRQAEVALNDISPQQAPPQQTSSAANDPAVIEWNRQNPWVADVNNPASPNYQKAGMAHSTFNNAISQGATPEQAVQIVNQVIAQNFPTQTRRAPTAQPPAAAPTRKAATLSYAQLSRAEQREVDIAVDNGMFTREEAVKKINQYRQEGVR